MNNTETSTRGITYSMSAEEVLEKVESGEISSCTCNSFAEYVRAMEA